MKKSRFTEEQIIKILKQAESGITSKEICRQHGISKAPGQEGRGLLCARYLPRK